jgi:hypothetical protein
VPGRTYQDQSEHDSLVRMMVNYFSTQGYLNIRADLDGFTRPDKLYWKGRENEPLIPDLTCQMNDPQRTQIILEAETCQSIGSDHTCEEWKLFSACATQFGKQFHVVVPRQCSVSGQYMDGGSLVHRFANLWGVIVHQIWWPSE